MAAIRFGVYNDPFLRRYTGNPYGYAESGPAPPIPATIPRWQPTPTPHPSEPITPDNIPVVPVHASVIAIGGRILLTHIGRGGREIMRASVD